MPATPQPPAQQQPRPSQHLRYAVNCSIMFTELPLLERPAAARSAGFEAVEYWWPFPVAVPTDAEVDRFVAAISDAGVQLVGLNFFAGDMPGGDRGLVSWPARSTEFVDNIAVVAGIGETLDCHAFNALYGNLIEGVSAQEQDEQATVNLTLAAQGVAGTVLIEPVSGAPRYPLKTAADAFAVIQRVQNHSGAGNLGLLADLYHLAVNGDDVAAVIARYTGVPGGVAHVQIADSPGRGEPGTGSLPLDHQLAQLESAGYRGWVGLEYKPTTAATADSFGWLDRTPTTAKI